jgi:hypothetical protein
MAWTRSVREKDWRATSQAFECMPMQVSVRRKHMVSAVLLIIESLQKIKTILYDARHEPEAASAENPNCSISVATDRW